MWTVFHEHIISQTLDMDTLLPIDTLAKLYYIETSINNEGFCLILERCHIKVKEDHIEGVWIAICVYMRVFETALV